MVEYRDIMLEAEADVCVLIEGAFPRHVDVGRFKGNRLVAVGLGNLHPAIPHSVVYVAAPKENQSGLEFRFVRDECHVRLRPF